MDGHSFVQIYIVAIIIVASSQHLSHLHVASQHLFRERRVGEWNLDSSRPTEDARLIRLAVLPCMYA